MTVVAGQTRSREWGHVAGQKVIDAELIGELLIH
jgi:hypothetical protein